MRAVARIHRGGRPSAAGSIVRLFGVMVMVAAAGCGGRIEPGETPAPSGPPVKAAVAAARPEPYPLTFDAVGTVRAETASTVAAQVMGTITAVRVKEGDRVRRGELLATIDGRRLTAGREQAEAALAEALRAAEAAAAGRQAAAAGAALAEATHGRFAAMLAREAVSRQEFDEVASRRSQAQAALAQAEEIQKAAAERVRQAQAALAAARVAAGDAEVTAAFDGVVAARLADPGDLAAPGTPLFRLEKAGGHRVELQVPEAYAGLVPPGREVAVRIEGPAPLALTGVVDAVAPAADPASRSFLAKVRLPAAEGLRSGMFARVALPVGEGRAIFVPASAVVRQGQLTGLYTVTAEGVARFRLIRTGRRVAERFEVLSGLPEGSRYVVAPPPTLVDGAAVEASS